MVEWSGREDFSIYDCICMILFMINVRGDREGVGCCFVDFDDACYSSCLYAESEKERL